MESGINPLILKKIEESSYSKEIKEIINLVLEFEDYKAKTNDKQYNAQYDKIISAYIK